MESDKVGALEELKMKLHNQEEINEGNTNESPLQVLSSNASLPVPELSEPAQAQEEDLAPKITNMPEIPEMPQPRQEADIPQLTDAAKPEEGVTPRSSEQTIKPLEGDTLKPSEQTIESLEGDTPKPSEETTKPVESDKVKVIQSKEDFEAVLKEAGEKLVVVDFSATWCGPCKIIKPLYYALSYKYDDVVFLEVDADECEELIKDCGIMCIPTFQFYRKEGKVGEFCGALKEKLEAIITELK
ncbi:thioredoxin domain-containing protein 2 [Orycteropus afer afer]|uniref:Thioredoxin domain-containing protein 2 n=1 Tax=Orycteropus afer afer TaxID=1230840 RepID=A0A8B7AHY8_ORYAF|nr:thioredoxin domain-containing protein 2 [Orycteropus afer afer]